MIQINERSMTPIYEQIINQVKELIVKGGLREGDKIPSVRELSGMLLINPNTVAKSYQELERQGVIATARGKGAFVCKPAASPGMERERGEQLREEMKRLIIEARHLGMTKAGFKTWVTDEVERNWGEQDADG
ncbi:GntR family transcriptional regulator [Cohnella luojiensis]|uniref:GntR family transcriptional regulator n=1 Tax=Cohnella luojiensis TaxID=652876 RepID=A0A4Y8LSW3_9BACL|nr:GntR family transcriptional regulator [Cohnella luojiensis]TFE19837.1 GntR family transcriptional regulator [Cohnella luojiensis]